MRSRGKMNCEARPTEFPSTVIEIRSDPDTVVKSPGCRTVQIVFQSFLWFSASICGTLVNKSLMKEFPYPMTLTALHLLSGITFNLAIARQQKSGWKMSSPYSQILPAAFFMIASKVFTYVSYGRVPASLTHTVKATSPIFSVLISRFHLKQPVSGFVFLALFPITIGVTLSSVSEINFELLGFFAALLSTLIGVLQNICTKSGLKLEKNPVVLYLHTNFLAFVMILVVGSATEFRQVFNLLMKHVEPLGGHTLLLDAANEIVPNPPLDEIVLDMRLVRLLMTSMLLHYLQSMSSLFVLNKVTAVTHQVSATIKRLTIIIASVWYFGNPVTLMNGIGVSLAVSGFFLYGYVNRMLVKRGPSNRLVTSEPPQIVVELSQKFRANNDIVSGFRGTISNVLTPFINEIRPVMC